MFHGRFSWIAEALGGLLLFLLPLKFGALTGIPAITMIYWDSFLPLLVSSWPFPVFPVFAAIFLLSTLLFVPGQQNLGRTTLFGGLWILLALLSLPGISASGNPPDAAMYFLDHAFSLGAFAYGFSRIIAAKPEKTGFYHGVFTAAFLISLLIGLQQYFSGFDDTIAQIRQQNLAETNAEIIKRLREQRVSAGFSACNAFAGYLVTGLPVALAWLWKAGNRVSPPHVSRLVFTIPAALCGLFLLIKTGSRGGILSLLLAIPVLLLTLKTSKKLKMAICILIPVGIAAFAGMVLFWRGAGSILFRLDYLQGAFRMMVQHPLTGVGWGGFQRKFMLMKWIYDAEAPASPHNFPLSLGSQCGAAAFLAAILLLGFVLWSLIRKIHGWTLKESLTESNLMLTASFFALTGWTFHCMQDVLYETPASVLCYAAVAILALGLLEPELTMKHRLPGVPAIGGCLLYAAASLLIAWNVLRFDSALAALNDISDPRMLTKEALAKADSAAVYAAFKRCSELNPKSPYPHIAISDFCAANGRMQDALQYSRNAVTLDPESAGLHMRLYRALRMDPDTAQEALQHLQRARELSPMNPKYAEITE